MGGGAPVRVALVDGWCEVGGGTPVGALGVWAWCTCEVGGGC